ncbi:TRAP transporter fused permease subunit [Ammoniphilus sp. YIM 78166]|uniref:TRAP transporter permease n=1 Tax=Ammoniphilus sp. YIM 78166 TaxID=1644106 RepID=UPI00106F3D66|nr:TRAP transporter fused permease subunit [Ammoniphilus sp. YIM 78166]
MWSKFKSVSAILAIIWAMFHMYTAVSGPMPATVQRAIHVAFALSLAFSLFPIGGNGKGFFKLANAITVTLPLIIGGYVVYHAERLNSRIWFVDKVEGLDLWLGIAFILLVLEASRRTVGKVMTILALVFIAYGFAGSYFDGLLQHRGLNVQHLVDLQFLSPDGIFGVPIGVAAEYVFYFVLFGAFLEVSGGGKLFIDIAYRITRRGKGGPAKAAIVSSGLMGSISGSAVANVVSTGIFTIPLMKRAGYSAKDAAAIEALASTGGQLMPPIMGAAAFIMAEMLGVPYVEIMLAALIPSLLYYLSIYIIVHIKAAKEQLVSANELEEEKIEILKRVHLLLPLTVLVAMIFMGYSLFTAAFWGILSIIAFSFLRKETFMTPEKILTAMVSGSKQAIQVTIPCAIAGIVVGIISFSGLGLKFTSIIVQWSLGNLVLALILVALGCIIMGMGMPTTSAYIMGSILLAPALENFGIHPIAAHMFILYFAVLSMITPPIALAAYSAAGISGSDMNETGMRAFLLSTGAFLIPFAFVLNPSLLLIGEVKDIIWMTVSTTMGIAALSYCVVGYMQTDIHWGIRIVLLISSVMMIIPESISDVLGFVLLIFVFLIQRLKARKVLDSNISV